MTTYVGTSMLDGVLSAKGGGRDVVNTATVSTPTYTVDIAAGNVHAITLASATVALSLTGAVSGRACAVTLLIGQDATGGRALTWPNSVAWPGGNAPVIATPAGSVTRIDIVTLDGGTTWTGYHATTTMVEADPGGVWMDNAVETLRRTDITQTSVASATGRLLLAYFTPHRTQTVTRLGTVCGGTAAAATPTLARIAGYEIATDGSAALVCTTGNIATNGCDERTSTGTLNTNIRLGASAAAEYTAPLSTNLSMPTSFTFIAGTRYALGVLIVTSATMMTFSGTQGTWGAWNREPRLAALVNGLTDLPTSLTRAQQLTAAVMPQVYGIA